MFDFVKIAAEGNVASYDWSGLASYGETIVNAIMSIVPTAIGVAVPILGVRKAISFFTGLIRSA